MKKSLEEFRIKEIKKLKAIKGGGVIPKLNRGLYIPKEECCREDGDEILEQ